MKRAAVVAAAVVSTGFALGPSAKTTVVHAQGCNGYSKYQNTASLIGDATGGCGYLAWWAYSGTCGGTCSDVNINLRVWVCGTLVYSKGVTEYNVSSVTLRAPSSGYYYYGSCGPQAQTWGHADGPSSHTFNISIG
jgi:hypothetical protein